MDVGTVWNLKLLILAILKADIDCITILIEFREIFLAILD